VTDHPVTLVTLGDLSKPQALLAAAGFLVIAALAVRKVPGAIIIGVLAVTIIAAALGLESWHGVAAAPPSLEPTFLKLDLGGIAKLSLIIIVLTLLLVTILDTAGTLIGVARQAGLLDKDGRLPRLRQALLADSGAGMLGALLGTSTTTAYIESAAGVEEGGRTGLTALVVALLFLLSLFLAPLAESVPGYATAPALFFVACLMAASLGALNFDDARLHPGADHRASDAAHLFHCHRHRARLHRLCGVEGAHRARQGDQRRGRRHRPGLPAQADLRLMPFSPTGLAICITDSSWLRCASCRPLIRLKAKRAQWADQLL
jgi:permease family protein